MRLSIFLLLFGCSGDEGIKFVRKHAPSDGAAIALKGVVTVGAVTNSRYGRAWVQDPGGGAFSGMALFCDYQDGSQCPMTQAQFERLHRGDVLDVFGYFKRFTTVAGGPFVMELEGVSVTDTGRRMDPVALAVGAAAVAKDQVAAEGYLGTYVEVSGPIMVTDTMPPWASDTCNAMTYSHGFEATAGAHVLGFAITFYQTLSSCLPGCIPCATEIKTGTSYELVRGIAEPTIAQAPVVLALSPVVDDDLKLAANPLTATCKHFCECAVAAGAPSQNCESSCNANPFGYSQDCIACIGALGCPDLVNSLHGCESLCN